MKTSSKNLDILNNFDLYNFEPNTLISMSFNFDILKYVIKELINSQKITNDELMELKDEFKEYKKNTSKEESPQEEMKISSNVPLEIKQKLEEEKNNEFVNSLETKNDINNPKTKENNNPQIINNNQDNSKLDSEKEIIENEINNKTKNEEENNKNKNEKNKTTEKINYNLEEKNDINIIIVNNNRKIIDNNENENELKVGIKEEQKSQNYNKILKDFEMFAEDLETLKSKQLSLENNFVEFKNSMDEKISKNLDNSFLNIEPKLNSKIERVQKLLNENIKKNSDEINSIKDNFYKNSSEISKNISMLSSKENNNNIALVELEESNIILKDKLNTISEAFSLYTKLTDFKQYKNDIFEKFNEDKKEISTNISLIQKSLNTLKGQFYDYINNMSDHNNIEMLIKKFDIIQNSIYKLVEFEKDMIEKEKRRVIIDPNKYVKNDIFNEFASRIQKIFDSNKKEFFELRLNLDDFKSKEVGTKATLKDLKSLEDNIYKKFEDLKLLMNEKFVDKNTLNKNKKIIEMQTKQLIEENKKIEKNENWLLAKRQVGGHLCASCEAYLGELSPNNSKFIPWNKYPLKDSSEKVFKIGGGISKVLQMVKAKNNNTNNNLNNSYNNDINRNSDSMISDQIEKEDKDIKSSKTRNNIKNINLNCLSNRNNIKKYLKNDEEEENNNLPMISQTMRKNNSSLNILSSDMANKATNTIRINNLKNNLKSNKYSQKNSYKNIIQTTDKEDYYLNYEKKI